MRKYDTTIFYPLTSIPVSDIVLGLCIEGRNEGKVSKNSAMGNLNACHFLQ